MDKIFWYILKNEEKHIIHIFGPFLCDDDDDDHQFIQRFKYQWASHARGAYQVSHFTELVKKRQKTLKRKDTDASFEDNIARVGMHSK